MNRIRVMIAGLPGKMAILIAEAIRRQDDMELYDCALSEGEGKVEVAGRVVSLVHPVKHESFMDMLSLHKYTDIIVDFTQPKAVNRNAEMYCRAGIPFVMGTTGGDRQLLAGTVAASEISAVIATNMAVPIIVFQAMVRFAAESFRGSFKGFRIVIRESHQATKPDPSGTAASLLEYFEALGMPLKKEQIIMVRDPVVQEVEMGIPQQYLGGHGYHTYTMLSSDGTVMLQFAHNVLGRSVYVDGALKAIRFLAERKHKEGTVYSMVDVLREVS